MQPGQRLGTYELKSLLGAGGMGEVYLARDSRLERDVAIKVLPEILAAVPDRAARFEREARVLASLNHPNVGAIHGIERDGGVTFLVLELVPGSTLAERIARGALTLDEVLPIARQIVDALEAAHEKGIVHRDLKPANIKVTAEGRVKVLDFGLAKALSSDSDELDAARAAAPTITTPAVTRAGLILGTAAYMSPEQARGKPVDKRADIWAFGCVLFEMLSGRRLFRNDEVSDTLAFILTKEPDWAELPANTPPSLRRLLRRCLEKDRNKRLADIADARIEIDDTIAAPVADSVSAPSAGVQTGAARFVLWAIAAAAIVVAAVALVTKGGAPQPTSATPVRLSAEPGAAIEGRPQSLVLSPDGKLMAFTARPAGGGATTQLRLFVRRLTELQATALDGTEGAREPFFSPDSKSIAFFGGGKLRRVDVTGGVVATICDSPSTGWNGSWTESGDIYFGAAQFSWTPGSLYRVPANGGQPEALAAAPKQWALRFPQVLPGGRAVLATSGARAEQVSFAEGNIVVQPLPAGAPKIVERGYSARYLPSGHIVFARGPTVYVAPFDLDRLEVVGAAVPMVDGVAGDATQGTSLFSVATDGTLAYIAGTESVDAPISWLSRSGGFSALSAKPLVWGMPRFSPDGRRLALVVNDARGRADIWTYDWARDTLTAVTNDAALDGSPVWSPAGQWIAFGSQRGGNETYNLYLQRADGAGEAIRLTNSPVSELPDSWHPGGKYLAFHDRDPKGTRNRLMILPLEGDEASGWKPGTPFVFFEGSSLLAFATFSPDGRWVAYASGETGQVEIYVRPFPGPGSKMTVSNAGGNDPRWSRSKPELLFRAPGPQGGPVFSVRYSTAGGDFKPTRPERWSTAPIGRPPFFQMATFYDLHPDGERLAVASAAKPVDTGPTNIVFVFNVFDELRRLTSVKGR